MANITTISSFTEEPIKIPNAVNESAGVDDNAGLVKVITESERKILKELLGDDQYATLQVELTKTPFTAGAAEAAQAEYVDLVNGSGAWQGLRPMLENYIFCAWLRATEIRLLMIGSGKGKTQGFEIADNSSKFAERWNCFVADYEAALEYIADSEFFEYEVAETYYETINSLGL